MKTLDRKRARKSRLGLEYAILVQLDGQDRAALEEMESRFRCSRVDVMRRALRELYAGQAPEPQEVAA